LWPPFFLFGGIMSNRIITNENDGKIRASQDVSSYLEFAKRSRDSQARGGDASHYRSFAIIPDIVAVDILTKHVLNLHDSEFMTNKEDVSKLKRIIKSEYPNLLTSHVTRG
jgi:hypothetical protein